jgi:hypothetical protein
MSDSFGQTRESLPSVGTFYDRLAPLYHLIYEDWEASVTRQGVALASLIGEHWGQAVRRACLRGAPL